MAHSSKAVRFAPTPSEEMAALLHLLLLACYWPLLLPITILLHVESWLAAPLGLYAGVVQGVALAAVSFAQLLLSRGGLRQLLLGRGSMLRAISVQMPSTPPRVEASADLHLMMSNNHSPPRSAASLSGPPAAEPAIPQPRIPPVVALATQGGGVAAAEGGKGLQPRRLQLEQQKRGGGEGLELELEEEDHLLLAAFVPAGPEATQAAAEWIGASEPEGSSGAAAILLSTPPRRPAARGAPLAHSPEVDAASTPPAASGGAQLQPGGLPQQLPAVDLAGGSLGATPAATASRSSTAAPAAAAAAAHPGSAQERSRVVSFPLAAGDVGTSDEEGAEEAALMGSLERGGLQAAAAGAAAEEVHGAMLSASIQAAATAGDACAVMGEAAAGNEAVGSTTRHTKAAHH